MVALMVEPAWATLKRYQLVSVMVWAVSVMVVLGGRGRAVSRSEFSADSYAPRSQATPNGRATPRWSASGQVAALALSRAGLLASRPCVGVSPPLLSSREPSRVVKIAAGLTPMSDPVAAQPVPLPKTL